MILIPENNSLRFVKRQYNGQPTGSTWSSQEAPFNRNYFNTRFFDEIASNIKPTIQLNAQLFGDYSQYLLQTFRNETIPVQLLSTEDLTDDSNIQVKYYKSDGTVGTPTKILTKKIDNREHKIRFNDVKFVNFGGFRAFYFEPSTFLEYGIFPNVIDSGKHYYNGEVPTWMEVDQDIEIFVGIGNPNNGTGSISWIGYSETYNAWVFLTNLSYVATSETEAQYIIITYERSEYDVYEYNLSGFPAETCLYLEIKTTETLGNFDAFVEKWESEFLYYELDPAEGLVILQWENDKDKFLIDFRTGIRNFCYLPMLTYDLLPDGDAEIYTDDNSGASLLDSNYKRKFKCEVMAIPRNMLEKLALAIRHEYFYINGKQFVWVGGSWNQERIEQTMLYNVDFEVYEPNLLGIYSTEYVNTKPSDSNAKLLIDDDNKLKIDDNNFLNIS